MVVAAAGLVDAQAASASVSAAQADPQQVKPPAGRQTFTATKARQGTSSTLRLTMDAARHGAKQRLTLADRRRIARVLGVPVHRLRPVPARKSLYAARPHAAAAGKGPATLRCDKNPTWSDGRGTLAARFNCHHSTVNWGYKISARVRSVISGNVHEAGVSWWRNGRRMPKNAGHVVGKTYHFHGTLKPVRHGDHVQFQDYMTFRVNIGGRTGTGSLAWAANVKAKK